MEKDLLLWDETLFKNRELFELDYVPEHFSHRESQMKSLKFCLRPALQGARPVSALCLGPPGTGKTTAVVKLFEEVEEHTRKVAPVYVNCQMDYTRYGVFHQIYRKIMGHPPPASGISFKRIFEKVTSRAVQEKTVLVIALDDLNYLFHEKEVDRVLYSLLRAHEMCPGVKVGVIAILSEPSLNYIFDPRVASIFQAEEITFPLYTRREIEDILRRRTELGFYDGVVSDEVLDLVVDLTEMAGDLRVGIDLLRRSAFSAESRASKHISHEDVQGSFDRSRLVHLSYAMKSLKENEMVVLRLAAEMSGSRAGEIYKAYFDRTGEGYTSFHQILNKLDAIRLIDTDYAGSGPRGRSRVVKIRYDAEEILSRLNGTTKAF